MDIKAVGISSLIVFAIGCVMHFLYDWCHENRAVAVVAATNESPWEHVKIGLTGFLVWTIVDYFRYGEMHNYWIAKGLSLMAFVILLLSIYYGSRNYVAKKHEVVFNIVCFLLEIVLAQVIFFAILDGPKLKEWLFYPAFICLFLVLGAWVMFTWVQPKVGVFCDPRNKKYGLEAHECHKHGAHGKAGKSGTSVKSGDVKNVGVKNVSVVKNTTKEAAPVKKSVAPVKKDVVEKRIAAAKKAPSVGKSVAKKRVVPSIDGMKKTA